LSTRLTRLDRIGSSFVAEDQASFEATTHTWRFPLIWYPPFASPPWGTGVPADPAMGLRSPLIGQSLGGSTGCGGALPE
jgi:hypothetical protein